VIFNGLWMAFQAESWRLRRESFEPSYENYDRQHRILARRCAEDLMGCSLEDSMELRARLLLALADLDVQEALQVRIQIAAARQANSTQCVQELEVDFYSRILLMEERLRDVLVCLESLNRTPLSGHVAHETITNWRQHVLFRLGRFDERAVRAGGLSPEVAQLAEFFRTRSAQVFTLGGSAFRPFVSFIRTRTAVIPSRFTSIGYQVLRLCIFRTEASPRSRLAAPARSANRGDASTLINTLEPS